jgi:hypothetical protein
MSTVKRINGGGYTIETVGASDNVFVNSSSLLVSNTIVANSIQASGVSAFTSNISVSNVSATGRVTAATFVGDGTGLTGIAAGNALGNIISYGTSNVAIPVLSGNVNISVGGIDDIAVFTTTGMSMVGRINVTNGLLTAGNIQLGGAISATGNINSTANVQGNYILGNGALLSGISATSSNINNGTTNVRIDVSGGNVAANVGGTANVLVLRSTGAVVTGVISATGTITTNGIITATGNITGGNLVASSEATAVGNITGGNLITGGLITATGNISSSARVSAANISTTGNITAAVTANVSGGNLIGITLVQGGTLSAVGNATVAGNITGGGSISAPGNITGGNLLTIGSVLATANLSAVGNVQGTYILGNGALLTGVVTGGGGAGNRANVNATTASLANAAVFNGTVTLAKGYSIYKITTSAASWVRVYTNIAARTADASRSQTTDPQPGSGVIAEVITTGANTVVMSPATIGFNDENPVSNTIPITVTNLSGSTTAVTVTFTYLGLEI